MGDIVKALAIGVLALVGFAAAMGSPLAVHPTIAQTPGTWASFAPMPEPRGLAGAAAVNGRVFVIGGTDNYFNVHPSVQIYDPIADSWTMGAPMITARSRMGVAAVGGKILAIGGQPANTDITSVVDLYDPDTDSWQPRASLPFSASGVAAATGRDGKVYAFGGYSGCCGVYRNSTVVYEPQTNTWSSRATMPSQREGAAAVTASDGKIYVIGGWNPDTGGGELRTVQSYDPATDTWLTKSPLPLPRDHSAAVLGDDGLIYLLGGRDGGVQRYNTQLDAWEILPGMPTPRGWVAGAAPGNGRVYAFGGFVPGSPWPWTWLATNEAFSTPSAAAPKWQQISARDEPGAPPPRRDHSAVWDPSGHRMLVFGGSVGDYLDPNGYFNDLWEYTEPGGWRKLTANRAVGSPPPRAHHIAVWDGDGNRMLVFGGSDYQGPAPYAHFGDLWEYTDGSGWREIHGTGRPGAPSGRLAMGAAWDSQAGRLLVFGGSTSTFGVPTCHFPYLTDGTNELWGFTDTGGWTLLTDYMQDCSVAPLLYPRNNLSAAWDDSAGRLLVLGGWAHGLQHLNDLWSYSAGTGWTALTPLNGPTSPAPRAQSAAAWDHSGEALYQFGGGNDTIVYNDLWRYSAAGGWESVVAQQAAGSPAARWGHTAVWDTQNGRLLVFGGADGRGTYFSDLWAFGVESTDLAPPKLTAHPSPLPNVNGWNRTDVTVTWSCTDTGSGVDPDASDLAPDVLTASGVATATCADFARNSAPPGAHTVKIDKTPPAANQTQLPPANGSGWNNTDVTVTWNWTDTGGSGIDPANCAPVSIASDEGVITLTASCTDNAGNVGISGHTVMVDKTAPVVTIASPVDLSTSLVGLVLSFSASDTTSGVKTLIGVLDDGTSSVAVEPGFQVLKPGVYTLTIAAIDFAGNSQSASIFFVVYDPQGGFVTGSGWFNSPLGAYVLSPSIVGKAFFGFVSRYQNGQSVPTGTTKFRFAAAGLDFQSTSYDWMVISGAKVQLRGVGTIAGTTGTFTFRLTAADGDLSSGGGIDRVRVQIWGGSGLIYDNQIGSPEGADATIAVQGGAITIHKP